MRRMLLTATVASALALGAPAVASAHHHRRHHKHHASAHVLVFKSAVAPSATNSPTTGPTSPTTESAGTVTGFKEGVLTITLTDGTVVSGKVTEQTRLECQSANDEQVGERDDQGGGDDQGASDSGEHGGPSTSARVSDSQGGDDQGDDAQGDDDQGAQEVCTTSALQPGVKVGEAELIVGSGGAVWEKVELLS
jgi:hypothetical protein